MKTFLGYLLCVLLCNVTFGKSTGDGSHSTFSLVVEPSPTSHVTNSSAHHNTSTAHPSTSTTHDNHSSSVHHNHSSSVHHNHSSSVHHNHSSSIHHNHSSSIHHNHSSSIHHNQSSTIHHNFTSSIMPSPSINFSISINMTSSMHNASHMTYTISPTHSISPNATSTVAPASSSMVPTTPPPPKWPTGKFSVKKGNDTCLLMWLSLEFTVKYKNVSSGEMISYNVVMPNASSAHATGTCEKGQSTIRISWEKYYYLEATFVTFKSAKLGDVKGHWKAQNLTLFVQVANNSAFVDGNTTLREIKETLTGQQNVGWLSGNDGNSFNCSKQFMGSGKHITATFENLRIQPFGVNEGHFSDHVDVCVSPTTPTPTKSPTHSPSKKKHSSNTVAIAVGCSLGGLVLIVLIGYFIGKRRKNSIKYRKL